MRDISINLVLRLEPKISDIRARSSSRFVTNVCDDGSSWSTRSSGFMLWS